VNDLLHDVLDGDRPIPLRRAAAPEVAASDPSPLGKGAVSESRGATVIGRGPGGVVVASGIHQNADRWALTNGCPEPAEPTPLPTGTVTESHRATRLDGELVGDVAEAAPPPRIATRWPAGPASATHPLTGLRDFRLEPVVVERPGGGRRDLARFLISFALVMAFVYALIVAFVLLLAHTRGTSL
jgi:hypothetical protein